MFRLTGKHELPRPGLTEQDAERAVMKHRLRTIEQQIAAESETRGGLPADGLEEFRYTGTDIRAEAKGARRILRGCACVFDALSANLGVTEPWRERLAVGCIDAEKVRNNSDFCLLWSHDESQILARVPETLSVDINGYGLRFSAQLGNTSLANDVWENVSNKNCRGMSFAMRVEKDDWDWIDVLDIEDPDPEEQSRSKVRLRTVQRCSIREISAVVWPAYKSSDVEAVTRALWPLGAPQTMPLEIRSHIHRPPTIPLMSREQLQKLQIRARLQAAELEMSINKENF